MGASASNRIGTRRGIRACESPQPSQFNWGYLDVLRWKLLPETFGGGQKFLYAYKDAWVRAHRKTIRSQARLRHLPAALVGGVAWIEVGGDPDSIDSVAYGVRRFDHSADPVLRPLTVTRDPETTSFGDVSIQLRRAAESMGESFDELDDDQRDELIKCLDDEDANLAIVARHLFDLKQLDFRGRTVGDAEIEIIASRYNRGPRLTLKQVKQNTSYGRFVLKIRARVNKLLTDDED